MKQKIVIKVELDCDKCRSKALKIAAEAKGVSSVALIGEEKDRLVVTGDVDAVCLARVLRKKFRGATLLSVQQAKEEAKENCCYYSACPPAPYGSCPSYYYTVYPRARYGSCPSYYYTVYDPDPNNCSIL